MNEKQKWSPTILAIFTFIGGSYVFIKYQYIKSAQLIPFEYLMPTIICGFIFVIIKATLSKFFRTDKIILIIIISTVAGTVCSFIWLLLAPGDFMLAPLIIGTAGGMYAGFLDSFWYASHNKRLKNDALKRAS